MATIAPARFPDLGRPPRRAPRRALVVALGLSVLLHAAWSLWPADEAAPESPPLQATLTEMPAPPQVAPPPVAQPTTRPRRPTSRLVPQRPVEPTASGPAEPGPARDVAPPAPAAPEPAPAVAPPAPPLPLIGPPPVKELPPRLDLAYKVYMGTQGFHIGDATYRFEHEGDTYRIATIAQARGLAALIVQGRGKVESHGRITANGLEPQTFEIERGRPDKREATQFDWSAKTVTLHDGRTLPLDGSTYDPLTILWQSYFTPPEGDSYTFSVATTRRVVRYTVTRDGAERLPWANGEVDTVRWHRVSEDTKTEAWFWLAPSLHYIPVKIRVTQTARGTLEVMLDAIRTDGTPLADPAAEPELPPVVQPTDPFREHGS